MTVKTVAIYRSAGPREDGETVGPQKYGDERFVILQFVCVAIRVKIKDSCYWVFGFQCRPIQNTVARTGGSVVLTVHLSRGAAYRVISKGREKCAWVVLFEFWLRSSPWRLPVCLAARKLPTFQWALRRS